MTKKPTKKTDTRNARARARGKPDDPAAVWLSPKQLKPWDRNPRLNDAAVPRVAAAIREFGFGAPIVARAADRRIIAGHTRWKAATQLGLERVPVRLVDLSERKAALMAAADNRLGELAEWDVPALQQLLSEFDLAEVELAGWSGDDLQAMADQLLGAADKERDVVEDEPPEPPEKPITRLGDVWELGRHRLVCGDATDPAVYDVLLEGAQVGLLTTDPPYGVSVTGGTHDPRDPNYRKGHDRRTIANDELTGERLEAFLRRAFTPAAERMVKGAAWYVWYAGTETRAFVDAAEVLGGFKHILVWVKPNFVFGRSDYHYRHEPVLYGWTPGAAHAWLGDRKQDSVFELGRDDAVGELKHPTVKPVKLYSIPIQNHLGADGSVLDNFAGSGPAFSAAEQTGRRCYGIELDPRFCDVIVERWQALTGGKAVRRGA